MGTLTVNDPSPRNAMVRVLRLADEVTMLNPVPGAFGMAISSATVPTARHTPTTPVARDGSTGALAELAIDRPTPRNSETNSRTTDSHDAWRMSMRTLVTRPCPEKVRNLASYSKPSASRAWYVRLSTAQPSPPELGSAIDALASDCMSVFHSASKSAPTVPWLSPLSQSAIWQR